MKYKHKNLYTYLVKINYFLPYNWRDMSVKNLIKDMIKKDNHGQLTEIIKSYSFLRILNTIFIIAKENRISLSHYENYKIFKLLEDKLKSDKKFKEDFYKALTDAIIPYNNDIKNIGEPCKFDKFDKILREVLDNEHRIYRRTSKNYL